MTLCGDSHCGLFARGIGFLVRLAFGGYRGMNWTMPAPTPPKRRPDEYDTVALALYLWPQLPANLGRQNHQAIDGLRGKGSTPRRLVLSKSDLGSCRHQ